MTYNLFNKELAFIFNCISNFYETHEEVNISIDDLANLVFANGVKDKEYYNSLLENIRTCEATASTTEELINSLVQKTKLKELSLLAYEAYEGKKDVSVVREFVNSFANSAPVPHALDEDFITDDLDTLVNVVVNTPGLRWRLNTVNRMLGSLRKGNFGFLFARPETGKTTFLASEVTHMCEQLKEEDGPILWIANEEPGANVKLRVYQSFFGITLSELRSDIPKWSKLFKEQSKSKIKILDKALVHRRDVEKVMSALQPSLLIVDQLDKIEGFEDDREDLKLGAIYRWARELAKQYCPVIAVCQADGTGEGVQWLTMGNVSNAKTAKQAEADWILGIGRSNKEGYESIRYLHLSKNKLIGDSDTDPGLRHGKMEVVIEPTIGRYRDLYL